MTPIRHDRLTSGSSVMHDRRRPLFAVALAALLVSLTAIPAFAQAPTHLQGPNFGTRPLGEVGIGLRASGGNGTYTWQLVGGSLPPGVSLRTDTFAFPSY